METESGAPVRQRRLGKSGEDSLRIFTFTRKIVLDSLAFWRDPLGMSERYLETAICLIQGVLRAPKFAFVNLKEFLAMSFVERLRRLSGSEFWVLDCSLLALLVAEPFGVPCRGGEG